MQLSPPPLTVASYKEQAQPTREVLSAGVTHLRGGIRVAEEKMQQQPAAACCRRGARCIVAPA